MTLGMLREPDLRPSGTGPQRIALHLVQSGLTARDDRRVRFPRLAEAVPSLDNGLWKLLPDGRMETTWQLRAGARWHDGAPVTAEDLLFSLDVGRDREMSAFNTQAYASIEDVRAPDPRTLTISWKEPFIEADGVLGEYTGGLLPKHLLEEAYHHDKVGFLDLVYWTSEFVGTGPYRLREWSPGVGMRLEANDNYVLGRPGLDQIDVKVIPDANTLSANLLAGTVDVAAEVGAIDLGMQLREQWREGTVAFNLGGETWVALFPQFVEPRPSTVAELPVRRALVQAINRQEMTDTLIAGLSPVAHTYLNMEKYPDVDGAVPRYEYDPRRAAQILEGLAYRKGADGVYRDAANQRLELEVRSGPEEEFAKGASAVADYWQRLGIDATVVRPSPQQFLDQQYVATFPAFLVLSGPNDVNALRFYNSSNARLPSNNFRIAGPGNRSRYMNAEFDGLLETYFRTVPMPERNQALGQIIHHMAEQLNVVGLYYYPRPGAISNRMVNVGQTWPLVHITWNAHEWGVRG